MRRAALLFAGAALACGDPELAGSTGAVDSSGATEELGGTTVTPTTAPTSDTGTADPPDPPDPSSTGSETGTTGGDDTTDTGEDPPPPVCGASDEPGGTVRWSLVGDELPRGLGRLAARPDGQLVLAGRHEPGGDLDVWVEVRDGSGAVQWADSYGGVHGLSDRAVGVAVDGAGFVHVLVEETVLYVLTEDWPISDARLVVLRFAPDGAQVWRWEHMREPVGPFESYSPIGDIAVVGDTIRVIERSYENDPTILVGLDSRGNMISEDVLELATSPWNAKLAIDAHGVHVAGTENLDQLWVARFDLDGQLAHGTWTVEDHVDIEAVFADDAGGSYLAMRTGDGPGVEHQLRRFAADGTVVSMAVLPGLLEHPARVADGALGCDGRPALVGGISRPAGPDLEWDSREDLWLARFTAEGASQWTHEEVFGPPYSHGSGSEVIALPDGDLLVTGSFLGDDGMTDVPFMRRFAGG